MLGNSPTGDRDVARYKKAAMEVYTFFGSYENLAMECYAKTGEPTAANTLRRWMQEQRLPIQYAVLFVEITDGKVHLFDFYPWIREYVS